MIGWASLAHSVKLIWGMKYRKYGCLHAFLFSSMIGTYQSSYTPYPDWSSSVSLRWVYQLDVPAFSISSWSSLWWDLTARAHCIFRVSLALYSRWSHLTTSALPLGQGTRGCSDRIWVIIGFSSRSQLSAVLASSAGCCKSEDFTWTAFSVSDKQRGSCRKDPSTLCFCKLAVWVLQIDGAHREEDDRDIEDICILEFLEGDRSKGCGVGLML